MITRTTKTTLTFLTPFLLDKFDEVLPPGTYDVEIVEEVLEGPSFTAYRRTRSYIHLPAMLSHGGFSRVFTVDPKVLDEALALDQASSASPAENEGMTAPER